jgi:hypothetical protein
MATLTFSQVTLAYAGLWSPRMTATDAKEAGERRIQEALQEDHQVYR